MDQLPRKPDQAAARLAVGDQILTVAKHDHPKDATPRPITSARVSPSRNAHPHPLNDPFNDPCNFLG